jgi:CHAT domain-containing protein/cytochrome c-type biogenesis protein CcmH/NrfG
MPENLEIKNLRKYLLGQITEQNDLDLIENRLIEDKEYFNELKSVEDELIDDYVFSELNEVELEGFKKLFLSVPKRVEKIKFTKSLRKIALEENNQSEPLTKKDFFPKWFLKPQFAFGLLLIIVLVGGFLVWIYKSRENGLDNNLADLFSIYEKERPVESRIVGLKYSPLIILRGDEKENTEYKIKKQKIEKQLLEKIDENPTAETFNALGIYYLTQRKFDDAIVQFENGLKINPNNAEIYSNLGSAYFEKAGKSNKEEKLEILPKALESLNKAIEIDNSRVEAIFNKALVLQDLNLPRDAAKTWNEYLEKDKASKWADEARKNLAELENQKTTGFKSKEKILEDFIRAFREKNDSEAWKIESQTKEMTTLRFLPNQLARQFIEAKLQKLPDKAQESISAINYIGSLEESNSADFFFKDLADFYQKAEEKDFPKLKQAFDLSEEGFASIGKSDYENAQTKLEQSRDIFIETGDVLDAKMLEPWIAQTYTRKGEIPKSNKILSELIEFSKEKNYKWLESSGLDIVGANYFINNEFSKALENYQTALKISEKNSDTYKQQRLLVGLLETYIKIGESTKSFFYLKKLLGIDDLYFQSDRQAWRNYIFGSEVFSRLDFMDAAIAYGQENLILGNEVLKNQTVVHNSHISLSKLYAKKKDFEDALENAEKSREIALQLNPDPQQKILLADSEVQIGNIKRQTGNYNEALISYDKALNVYNQLPSFRKDFYAAKKGKLICFQEQNKPDLVERELPEVLELYEKYRTKILEEESRNVFFADEQTVYDIAIDNYLSKGDEKKAFEYAENSKARSLLDFIENKAEVKNTEIKYTDAVKSFSLNEIQEKIPFEVQIVQFAVLPEKIVIWSLSKENFKTFKIDISQTEIEQKVNDYLTTIIGEKDNLEKMNRQSAELYKIIISPIKADLDKNKEIFIVPDKILNRLPFASLFSDENKKYLIEDYTIALTPSATVFVVASEKAASKNESKQEKLLNIGNPAFDQTKNPNLSNLKAAEREVTDISKIYSQATTIRNEKATKESFLREIQKNDILHFAGHYLANETSPLNSRLLLADDKNSEGDLRVFEIAEQKNQNLKLAILSACQTGMEKYYNGEGAVGIARIFLAIGVPSVVASQWEVDSDSTADLMINFHRNRKIKGLSTAKALREAQIEALNSTKKSPFYWSAFNNVGGFTKY